jgi:type I restriction enzyme, S subunit
MTDWKECKLADAPFEIIDGDRGTNYPKQNEFSQNGYCLFLNAKNVTTDGFAFNECYFISKEKDQILRKGKLQRNDIVLTTRGTVGNIGFFNDRIPYENIRLNSGMVIIRSDPKGILPEYTHQLFKYLKSDFDVFATGSAQPQLPIRDLKEIFFLLPPLPEQSVIAGVLSSLDDKIDLLHRQNKTLEGMAEAVFRQRFIEGLSPSREGFFGELIETTISGEWGKDVPEGDYNQRVYCVRGTDIDDLRFSIPSRIPERFIKSSKLEKILPKPGDLILEISGGTENQSTGRTICIDESLIQFFDAPVIYSNFCRLIRPKKKEYGCFLYLYCQWLYAQNEFFNLENGTSGIKNLDYKNLLTTNKVNIPKNLGDILIFESEIRASFQKIGLNRKQIHTLSRLRDTLLSKLMSGEVRVRK